MLSAYNQTKNVAYLISRSNIFKKNFPILINNISRTNKYAYVKMKDIEEIKQQNNKSGTLKIVSKITGFFLKQVWTDFKQDFQLFQKIRSKPASIRTVQEKYAFRRIRIDMIKFGPAFCVFNIPFGFPLFYLYLTFFPQMIPSWMMVDSIHNKSEQLQESRKKQSLNFYIKNYGKEVWLSYLHQAIHKQNQSLEDLRRISCICFGDYIDGTQYISRKLKIDLKNGLIHPKISKFLINFYMFNQLRHQYQIQKQLNRLQSYKQRLSFKLDHQISKININQQIKESLNSN